MTDTKKKRTNEQILADLVAERKTPKKRVRRTKVQIARDEEKKRLAELAARPTPTVKVVRFLVSDFNAFGKLWKAGEEIELAEHTQAYKLAFDKNGDFILDKTPEQQLKLWGKVKYEIREEPVT